MVFQGLRTQIFRVPKADLKKASEWYARLTAKDPYFETEHYVGFDIGGFELGLEPAEEKVVLGNNINTYWGVKNIDMMLAHCLTVGAVVDSDIRDVGSDIKVATLKDPFGNIFGLIEHPNFKIE